MAVSTPTVIVGYASTASVTTSGAQTLTASVAVGEMILVAVGGAASGSTFTVSDSEGHTYTQLSQANQGTGTLAQTTIFYTVATNAMNTSDTITVTRSTSNSLAFSAQKVSGQASSPIGNGGTTPTNTSSSSVTTATTASVTHDLGDLVLMSVINNGNATAQAGSNGFTTGNFRATSGTNPRDLSTAYYASTTASTIVPTLTWSTSGIYGAVAVVISAPSPATGALATTLDGATLAASGTHTASGATGTLATTLDGATLSASGAETFTGTLATTLAGATLVASGTQTVNVTGTLATTLAGSTLVASGTETFTGTLATTLAGATLAGSGTESMTGTLATTLAGVSLAGSGTETIPGTLATTLAGGAWIAVQMVIPPD